MQVIYAQEPLPTTVKKTIFLAGPSPRTDEDLSWRPEALRLLELMKYDGHVFSPEPRDGKFQDYVGQIEWETAALERADVILFWIPRTKMMPGLTTNVEWGVWMKSGKVVLGSPDGAESMRYIKHLAQKHNVPSFDSLSTATLVAIDKLGAGSERNGDGECQVPLNVWTAGAVRRRLHVSCNTLRNWWVTKFGEDAVKLRARTIQAKAVTKTGHQNKGQPSSTKKES